MEEKERKELEKEMDEKTVASRKVEIETFTNNLATAKEAVQYQKEQMVVASKLRKLQMEGDNQELITPTLKYHNLPEFWELNKEILRFKDIMENKQDEGRVKQMEVGLKQVQEQLDNALEQLKELEEKEE